MGTEVINVGDTVEFTFDLGGVATTLTGEVKQYIQALGNWRILVAGVPHYIKDYKYVKLV